MASLTAVMSKSFTETFAAVFSFLIKSKGTVGKITASRLPECFILAWFILEKTVSSSYLVAPSVRTWPVASNKDQMVERIPFVFFVLPFPPPTPDALLLNDIGD